MTIRRKGPPPKMPSIPPRKISDLLDYVALYITTRTKLRTARGQSVKNTPFRQYSPSYQRALRRGGESTKPDLTVTGGLLKSLTTKEKRIGSPRSWVIVGPSSKKPRAYHFAKGRRKWSKASVKLDYAQIGYVHQHGSTDGRVPPRPWLGLTTREQIDLARKIRKRAGNLVVFRAGRGRVGLRSTKPRPGK